MPQAARKGDIGSGHGCHFPPSVSIEGSPDVFINGQPAMRKGDAYAAHACPIHGGGHGRKLAAGSATVNINHKPAGRIGDAIDCGGNHATGSPNVIIGDDTYNGATGPAKPKFRFMLTQYPGDENCAYANEPYKLYHNGALVKEGKTGDDGMIDYEPEELTGAFKVEALHSVWNLAMQAFSPADTDAGFKQRLSALGFGNHSEKVLKPGAEIKDKTPSEIGHFQASSGEEVEPGANDTVKKLLKAILP